MIVCCPSCQARYRVPEAVETDHGRCSRCHDPVPLVEPRRTYLVRTPGASEGRSGRVVGRLTIGMDDPTLAGRVGRSGLDAPGGAALTFRVFASDLRAGAPAAGVEPPGPRPAAREDPAPPFGIPSYEEAEFGLDPHEAAAFLDEPVTTSSLLDGADEGPPPPERAAPDESEADGPVRRPARDLLTVAVSAAVGVAAGYHGTVRGWFEPFAGVPGLAPVDPILVGGLLGLLIGWGAVRWMTRRR